MLFANQNCVFVTFNKKLENGKSSDCLSVIIICYDFIIIFNFTNINFFFVFTWTLHAILLPVYYDGKNNANGKNDVKILIVSVMWYHPLTINTKNICGRNCIKGSHRRVPPSSSTCLPFQSFFSTLLRAKRNKARRKKVKRERLVRTL